MDTDIPYHCLCFLVEVKVFYIDGQTFGVFRKIVHLGYFRGVGFMVIGTCDTMGAGNLKEIE